MNYVSEEIDDKSMQRRFLGLRSDIRNYLANHLKSAEFYWQKRFQEEAAEEEAMTIHSLASAERWQEYEKHKAAISRLCGLDAPEEKQDQEMFDATMRYLVDRLLV